MKHVQNDGDVFSDTKETNEGICDPYLHCIFARTYNHIVVIFHG